MNQDHLNASAALAERRGKITGRSLQRQHAQDYSESGSLSFGNLSTNDVLAPRSSDAHHGGRSLESCHISEILRQSTTEIDDSGNSSRSADLPQKKRSSFYEELLRAQSLMAAEEAKVLAGQMNHQIGYSDSFVAKTKKEMSLYEEMIASQEESMGAVDTTNRSVAGAQNSTDNRAGGSRMSLYQELLLLEESMGNIRLSTEANQISNSRERFSTSLSSLPIRRQLNLPTTNSLSQSDSNLHATMSDSLNLSPANSSASRLEDIFKSPKIDYSAIDKLLRSSDDAPYNSSIASQEFFSAGPPLVGTRDERRFFSSSDLFSKADYQYESTKVRTSTSSSDDKRTESSGNSISNAKPQASALRTMSLKQNYDETIRYDMNQDGTRKKEFKRNAMKNGRQLMADSMAKPSCADVDIREAPALMQTTTAVLLKDSYDEMIRSKMSQYGAASKSSGGGDANALYERNELRQGKTSFPAKQSDSLPKATPLERSSAATIKEVSYEYMIHSKMNQDGTEPKFIRDDNLQRNRNTIGTSNVEGLTLPLKQKNDLARTKTPESDVGAKRDDSSSYDDRIREKAIQYGTQTTYFRVVDGSEKGHNSFSEPVQQIEELSSLTPRQVDCTYLDKLQRAVLSVKEKDTTLDDHQLAVNLGKDMLRDDIQRKIQKDEEERRARQKNRDNFDNASVQIGKDMLCDDVHRKIQTEQDTRAKKAQRKDDKVSEKGQEHQNLSCFEKKEAQDDPRAQSNGLSPRKMDRRHRSTQTVLSSATQETLQEPSPDAAALYEASADSQSNKQQTNELEKAQCTNGVEIPNSPSRGAFLPNIFKGRRLRNTSKTK